MEGEIHPVTKHASHSAAEGQTVRVRIHQQLVQVGGFSFFCLPSSAHLAAARRERRPSSDGDARIGAWVVA